MSERTVPRFTTAERVFHWAYFVAFTMLGVTGFILLFPWSPFAVGEAGQTNRLLHRIFAVVLLVAPLVTLLASPAFRRDMAEAFTWRREDVESLRILLLRAYWTGDRTGLPPQGKFMAGQKLNIVAQTLLFLALGASGVVIWFGKGLVPQGLVQVVIVVHALAAIAAATFAIVHVYMVTTLPATRDAVAAMFTGRMSEELARSHHARWYAEVTRRPAARTQAP